MSLQLETQIHTAAILPKAHGSVDPTGLCASVGLPRSSPGPHWIEQACHALGCRLPTSRFTTREAPHRFLCGTPEEAPADYICTTTYVHTYIRMYRHTFYNMSCMNMSLHTHVHIYIHTCIHRLLICSPLRSSGNRPQNDTNIHTQTQQFSNDNL